jgi:LuxR family transcriptional regulator, maltose regulon positive regulatory protein
MGKVKQKRSGHSCSQSVKRRLFGKSKGYLLPLGEMYITILLGKYPRVREVSRQGNGRNLCSSKVMAGSSLLSTKLFVPQAKAGLVLRSRLTQKIQAGLGGKLTLVSAPAGFGKTTLLASWVAEAGQPTAWVSLDEADNEPNRFLGHVAAALGTFRPHLGEYMSQLLEADTPLEALLTNLVNKLNEKPTPLSLVLDDYHVIQNGSVHKAMNFLLEHAPPHFTVLMTTRNDPPLPLPRWRVRGELTEVRASDLRFSFEETHQFLQNLGLELTPEDVESLGQRTEGWAVGLQLAALSLQQEEDKTAFIKAFAGDHRYVLDYLMDEVLERQDETVQTFLLKTSVLGRFCSSLCDAVVYLQAAHEHAAQRPLNGKSEAMLSYLERTNLFLIPLDNKREWYRYHHLFADLLRLRLQKLYPEEETKLHVLAAVWHESKGHTGEALQHLLAAKQFAQAGKLIELMGNETLWGRGEVTTLASWLTSLPPTILHSSAKLCLLKAWILYQQGQLEGIPAPLASADTLLRQARTHAALDEETVEALEGELLAVRSFIIRMKGELKTAIDYSRQALEQIPPHAAQMRALVMANIAECYFLQGDLTAAAPACAQASTACLAAGNVFPGLFMLHRLATTQMLQGHLREALSTCARMMSLTKDEERRHVAGLANIQLGLVQAQRNELENAAKHLEEGIEEGKRVGNPRIFFHGLVALAHVLQAQGKEEESLRVIEEAAELEHEHQMTWSWGMPSAVVAKANLETRREHPERALQTLAPFRANLKEIPFYEEESYIALARALLATNKVAEASALLKRLRSSIDTNKRNGRLLELLVLEALTFQAQKKNTQALETLQHALKLAEPEGYVRVFVDEGRAMLTLLENALSKNGPQRYLEQLLSAFTETTTVTPLGLDYMDSKPMYSKPPSVQTVEGLESDLSERELTILRLMSGRLSDKEIATQLDLSVNTVKWYARHIYEKLGVHKRTSAVSQARRLGLL